MHSIEELGTNVSAFLAKLWKIVEDPETNDLISWCSGGTSFYIRDQARFSRELLPLYYKHNNMASFIRQLNMYGFHKVVSIEGGGLRPDKDEMEFAHQCFLMDHPYLLAHIKRKIPVQRMEESVDGSHPELIKRVLTDVKGLKGRQDNLNSQLSDMKRENEVLWRELAVLRQKHIKQQQIVNKLIQFLVSMVHNTHARSAGIGIKRYMLSSFPHNEIPNKHSKDNVDNLNTSNTSPGGPVIHELDPTESLEECMPSTNEEELPNSESFLPVDICQEPDRVQEVLSPNSSTGSMSSLEAAVNTASPDVLLELAEECSLTAPVLELKQTLQPKRDESSVTSGNRKKRLQKIETENDEASFYKESLRDKLKDVMLPSFTKEITEDSSKAVSGTAEENLWKELSIDPDAPSLLGPSGSGSSRKKRKLETKNEKNGDNPSPSTSKSNASRSTSPNLALSRTVSSDLSRCSLPEDLDLHLDSMDSELDGIKELLRGEGYSLDANTLLGVRPSVLGLTLDQELLKLFNEDPLAYEFPMGMENEGNKVSGGELMAYTPNNPVLDFADLFGSSDAEDWRLPASPEPRKDSDMNTPLTKSEILEGSDELPRKK